MERELVMSGVGGQGILLATDLLAEAACEAGLYVTHMSRFAGAIRGGASDCFVVVGDTPIEGVPIFLDPWSVVIMHPRAARELLQGVKPGGLAVRNKSLVEVSEHRSDIQVLDIPASDMASQLGSVLAASMVALGAYVALTKVVPLETVTRALTKVLPPHRSKLITLDAKAIEAGARFATNGAAFRAGKG